MLYAGAIRFPAIAGKGGQSACSARAGDFQRGVCFGSQDLFLWPIGRNYAEDVVV